LSGADLGARVAIILGIANLVGDGVSMAAGNYLGMRSEIQQRGGDLAGEKPWRHGLATFAAFALVGAVPLLAFLVPFGDPLWTAGALTALTLFAVGSLRARFVPGKKAWRLGFEMVAIAAIAAAAALGVGVVATRLA
ncbi:MAG: VIT1/CCC1 transporter family protein, partial [Candidatus Thermoplasmatota archaeon]